LRVAVIGRTEMLLDAARRVQSDGHIISLVATCKESGHELAGAVDFERLAKESEAPFLQGRALASEGGLAVIREARCDIAISMNWLTLIPSSVRDCIRLGVFNAHPGDLPRFKGNACPNWAILLGEPHVALTIHAMADQLDAGPIFEKTYLALHNDVDMRQVYEWLRTAVPEAYQRLIKAAANDVLQLMSQPENPQLGLRCYPRRPEDGRIDWTRPTQDVLRLVRASTRPFAGAFTFLEGSRRLTIWSGRVEQILEPFCAAPGQVAFGVGGDPVIAGSDGYLRLLDIELEGCNSVVEAKTAVLSSLRNRLI
jgi:methionyl-tRNA formyltransferase